MYKYISLKLLLTFSLFIADYFLIQVAHAVEKDNNEVGSPSSSWREDWIIRENFSLEMDTSGYNLPTSIAFIPNPGNKPKDPLYFVTELRGAIKVVTNDRTVSTFAHGFMYTAPDETLPLKDEGDLENESEFGLAGICLAPEKGYVFATYAYHDENKILKNNIIRFETKPEKFDTKPKSQKLFSEIFETYESGPSHQIGNCQVHNSQLYVGLGDGFKNPNTSQNLDLLLGKVIRMTLDGDPVSDNPFYINNKKKIAKNYIWSYGLRNPFGIKVVNNKVIVVDNGAAIDRFLEVKPGVNYLWDGNDQSIAANSAYVFQPSLGPVQMDYHPLMNKSSIFPAQYKNTFFVALSAAFKRGNQPGIFYIPYSTVSGVITSVPDYFVKYRGTSIQLVTGLALGDDALYFTPLLALHNGKSAVLKIKYDPASSHKYTSFTDPTQNRKFASQFLRKKGCIGCHSIKNTFEHGGTAGPILDRGDGPMHERILKRINSQEYLNKLEELNQFDTEPFSKYKKVRLKIARTKGLEQLKLYLKYQVLEPRFDNPHSLMPNMGLNESEAEAIANYFVSNTTKGLMDRIKGYLPRPRHIYTLTALCIGIVFGVLLWISIQKIIYYKRFQSRE